MDLARSMDAPFQHTSNLLIARYGYGLLSSKDFLSWKVQHYICILLASSSAMIVMVIMLCHNFCRGRLTYEKYHEMSDRSHIRWTALKQLLPLAAFPLLFFVFIIPFSIFDVYCSFITPTPDNGLVLVAYLSTSINQYLIHMVNH